MKTATTVTTTCSGCARPVRLDLMEGTVSVLGATEHLFIGYNDLAMWDCPACDYADSYGSDEVG